MKTKKILCAFLTAFLCVTAVSCGDTEEESTENSSVSQTETETQEKETETQEESEQETESQEESKTEEETENQEEEFETEENTENQEESETEEESENQEDISAVNANAYGTTADITDYINTTEITPPLWKVTDPETQNELYIMGTIHVLPVDFESLPDYINDIYLNSDGIAVEYDISQLTSDIRALITYQQMFLYDDGTTVQDHISDETYQKAKAYFESIGAYSEELDLYSAGYWYSSLDNAMIYRLENLSTDGIDSQAIASAQADGKEVISIETLSAQTSAIDGMSDELVDYVMNEMLDNMDKIDDYAENLAELYNLWAVGDVDPMLDENTEEMNELPEDLIDDYEEYMDAMLYNRNKVMAERASEFIKDGKNYLFMVGSAHYAGDKGVDDLLAEMGYTVEKIQ